MKCTKLWIYTLMIALFSLTGCKSEDPNPELKDPIYKDLQSLSSEHQKNFEEQKKHREELELSMQKLEVNSLDLKKARLDLDKTLRVMRDAEQKALYYKIRAERRRVEGRLAYKIAFHQGKEWPDPAEYSGYLVNKRVNEINLNWNARVPKLADRTPAHKPAPAKPAAGGSH